MNLYFRALSYVKPYIFRAILAMLCAGIAAGGTAYLPWIIKDMVDSVLSHKDTAMLNYIVISIIVVFAIRGIAAFLQYYLMHYVGQRVIIDIRSEVFAKIQRLSMSFFDKKKSRRMKPPADIHNCKSDACTGRNSIRGVRSGRLLLNAKLL